MNRKIVIIYDSEIFRKGLVAIIKSYFNVEVEHLNSIEELFIVENLGNTNLILFIDPEHIEPAKINAFSGANEFRIVAIRSEKAKSYSGFKFDANINLKTTASEIQELLSKFFNKFQNIKKDDTELSQRELEVLRLVALGKTNKNIAEELYISTHTVISHRKNITEKLGIKSISGLTVYAFINKIIDPENLDLDKLI